MGWRETYSNGISSRLVRRYQVGMFFLLIWWVLSHFEKGPSAGAESLLCLGMAILQSALLALPILGRTHKEIWILLCWASAMLSMGMSLMMFLTGGLPLLLLLSLAIGISIAAVSAWRNTPEPPATLEEGIHSILVPTVELNTEGVIRCWNPAFEAAFIVPKGNKIPTDLEEQLLKILTNVQRKGKTETLDWAYEAYVYRTKVQLLAEGEGCRLYFFDITREKDIEEKYRIIVEGTNEALVIVNLKGEISFVNQQFCKLFGYAKEELIGKLASGRIVDDSNRDLIQSRIRDRIAGKGEIYHAKQRTKNGNEIWTLVSASPYRDHKGVVVGIVAAITDLSPLMQVQDALQDRNEEMKMFLYKASHDIKGPLASIKGILNLALDESLDTDTRNRYIHMAINSAIKLDNAISDLVKVSQVHNQPIQVSQVKVPMLINKIIGELSLTEVSKEVDLQLSSNIYMPFWSDKDILHTMLENLMINACTYKKGGPVKHRVKVSVDSYHKGVRIVISDNGVGIRLDLQEKVFDMFYRGNKDSSGTGLGLYLVKQGVRKLDGKVSLHSEEGVGTQVILYLPSLEKSEEEKVEHLSHVNSQAYH